MAIWRASTMVSHDKRAADVSKIKIRVEKLRAQLREAEIVVITGVVDPSGPGGAGNSREADEWLLLSLAYWRLPDGELRESKLTLRKPMSRAELHATFKRVRPYDLLQAKVRLVEHPV